MDLDNLIFSFTRTSIDYDRSTWIRIAAHLINRLSHALGHHVSPEGKEEDWSIGDGLSVDVRSEGVGSKRWEFGIRGIVGAQIIGDQLLVRAWIFVYFGNVRLSVKGKGDVLVMKYVRRGEHGEWEAWENGREPNGWQFGELGEFDAFERFNEE